MRPVSLFLALLAALALFWEPGVYFNDDVAQAAGLTTLAAGGLRVDTADLPAGYDPFLQGLFRHFSFAPEGQSAPPFGSMLLNVLALPPLLLLRALAGPFGAPVALALAQCGLLAAGGAALHRLRPRWVPDWRHAAALPFAVLLPVALLQPQQPSSPFLELAAQQLVAMAATALAAALLHDLVRRFASPRTAALCSLLLVAATPLFWWSQAAKQHALGAALLVLTVWLYRQGHRTPPLRTGLAFGVAGLSVASSPQFGGLLAITLGLLFLPVVRLGRHAWPRIGAAATAAALGLLPELVLRSLDATGFVPELGRGGDLSYLFDPDHPLGWLSHTVFTEPWLAAKAALRTAFWTTWRQSGPALALACSVPALVVLGPALGSRTLRRQVPAPLRAWALTYAAVLFGVMGTFLLRPGSTPDMRYASTLWPLAVLLAAPWIEAASRRHPADWWTAAMAGPAIIWTAGVLTATLLLHRAFDFFTGQGRVFEVLFFFRYGGAALAALVGVLAIAGSRHPRSRHDRFDAIVGAAAGFSVSLQAVVYLAIGHNDNLGATFVAWPVELLAEAVRWMMLSLA